MATEILMPTLGLTMTEGTVDEWLVQEGDTVSKGDPVATISSEKLSSDVEAPADGVIIQIVANVGDVIPIKKPMAYVGETGETVGDAGGPASEVVEAEVEEVGEVGEVETAPATVKAEVPREAGERIFITPVARKMAEEKGYDIALINGTGGNGRITKRDIERYQPAVDSPAVAPVAAASPVAADVEYGAGLQGMRKTIAQRMMRSVQTTAQVTLHRKANITRLMAFRKDMKEKVTMPLEQGQLSLNTLVTRAAILALKETPEMNAWYHNGEYILMDDVHIGMAVAVDDGLVVPVVKNAGVMNLTELGTRIGEVADQVRNGTLPGDLYSGSTFTITNLGQQGVEYFTPIINSPEIGILGVGTMVKELALDEEDNVVQEMKLGLSLTFDHQIIDGSPAADFLALIVNYLEDPYRLLL